MVESGKALAKQSPFSLQYLICILPRYWEHFINNIANGPLVFFSWTLPAAPELTHSGIHTPGLWSIINCYNVALTIFMNLVFFLFPIISLG